MRASQLYWNEASGWSDPVANTSPAGLVLYFGTRAMLSANNPYAALKHRFKDAHILGCSTGGQMVGGDASDDTLCALAFEFEKTEIRVTKAVIDGPHESRSCGEAIGAALKGKGLAGIFVLSDGLKVNGSALVEGIVHAIGRDIPVSGGLAGDGADFSETLVGCDGEAATGTVAAVGFYGDAVRFGYGSAGGWDVFGPMRQISGSEGNVLHELDGHSALDLYKLYLGPEDSQKLPGSALLFPLRIFDPRHPDRRVVRTVLSVDHETGSMTFAGDMPKGWSAQLMRGSFSRLSAGAGDAAQKAMSAMEPGTQSAAILVSCIGRRLLMGQRIDEEIEAVDAELDANCRSIGFYSYGEISPHEGSGDCQLHNQTMTVTVLGEQLL
jgi:hypothetical protein